MVSKLDKQIEDTEKKLKELKAKKLEEESKELYLEIPEKGIAITTKLQFKDKSYKEIVKEVGEENLPTFELLKDLRNEGFKSGWKKYGFLKEFRAFVQTPDEVSKSNGYVARFGANSGMLS
jgi:hypothetical protein